MNLKNFIKFVIAILFIIFSSISYGEKIYIYQDSSSGNTLITNADKKYSTDKSIYLKKVITHPDSKIVTWSVNQDKNKSLTLAKSNVVTNIVSKDDKESDLDKLVKDLEYGYYKDAGAK